MKVESLELVNYKKITSLLLSPKGDNVQVTGSTGQGKTTVISALWEAMEMVGEPIKTGTNKAIIKLTISDGKKKVFAERVFTAKTKKITIVDSEGKTISVAEFKTWFSDLGVNPQKLLNLGPTEFMGKVLQCVKFEDPDFNLGELEYSIKEAESTRSTLNSIAKSLSDSLPEKPEQVEHVSVTDLLADLEKEKEAYRLYETRKKMVEDKEKRFEEVEAQISLLRQEKAELLKVIPPAKAWCSKQVFHIQEKNEALLNASENNEKSTKYESWMTKEAEAKEAKTKAEKAVKTLEELRSKRKEALGTAIWPVPNMAFEDGVVYYNNVPFQQAGDSEKMMVTGILAAHEIKNKKLKVVRMDGIESMSPENFDTLQKYYNKHGIQVWSSRVAWGEVMQGELVIEDGGLL